MEYFLGSYTVDDDVVCYILIKANGRGEACKKLAQHIENHNNKIKGFTLAGHWFYDEVQEAI